MVNAASIFKAADEIIECQRCGACCSNFTGLFIRKAEIRVIAKRLKISVKKFKRRYNPTHKATHLWRLRGDPCHFLKGKNQCTIYEVRPLTCRAFPFANMLYATLSKKAETVKFQKQCPKSMTLLSLFDNPEFSDLLSLATKFTAEQYRGLRTIMMGVAGGKRVG